MSVFNSLTLLHWIPGMKAKPLSTQKHRSGPFPLFITPGFLELLQISRGQTKPKSFAPSQPNSPVGAKVRTARRGISVIDQAGKTHHFSAARRHEALRRSYGPPAHRDLCRLLLPCACSGHSVTVSAPHRSFYFCSIWSALI